eukprot:1158371-Pelagomonas_calceolata.AAC.4
MGLGSMGGCMYISESISGCCRQQLAAECAWERACAAATASSLPLNVRKQEHCSILLLQVHGIGKHAWLHVHVRVLVAVTASSLLLHVHWIGKHEWLHVHAGEY